LLPQAALAFKGRLARREAAQEHQTVIAAGKRK